MLKYFKLLTLKTQFAKLFGHQNFKKSYKFMNFKYDVAKGLKISKDNQG